MDRTAAGRALIGGGNGPEFIRASVFLDGGEVPYLRAGHGRCVLALSADPRTRIALGAVLASGFRVIAPLEEDGPRVFPVVRSAAWIAAFLDGLGIGTAAVVAGPEWAAAAFQLEREDLERVDRVLCLEPADAASIDTIRGALDEAARAFPDASRSPG